MQKIKNFILLFIIFVSALILTSCWNYREIDQLTVAAGVAIDKGINKKYSLTIEIVELSAEKESKTNSKTITAEGDTIFDAARNTISFTGKKVYWSHAKIVIISREIASEGIISVLDWFQRDAETRGDIHIVVSRAKSAKEILKKSAVTKEVTSFELDSILKFQRVLSKSPVIEIWKLTNELAEKGISAIATAIDVREENGENVAFVEGTAIFKGDRLAGFIDGEETMNMLFVRDEIKGGVLLGDEGDEDGHENISLEIFDNKTKINPVFNEGDIEFNVNIKTEVAIDEIEGTMDVIDDEGRKKLKECTEKSLKNRIESIIKKAQLEYGTDIFGFGNKLYEERPKLWDALGSSWEEKFKDLKVNVKADVKIKNSAMLSKPLRTGD